MAEISTRMYVESVSSATVTLEPEPFARQGAGQGIATVVVTTREATANAAFWGTTGSCGRYEVIFRKVS